MQFMDALEEFSGSNDHHSLLIKGKRTKRRQRPLSPVGRAVAAAAAVTVASSSSSGEDDQGGGRDGEVLGYIYSLIPSPTTMSTSDTSISAASTDQQDEDMANCLILLAQGESCRKQVNQEHEIKMEKFSSRRFNEMATTTTGGKVGFFVYECKTCNRTFPSFQALGGHRASHKKLKLNIEENKATIATPSNDHHHEEQEEEEKKEIEEEQAAGQLINRLSPCPPLSVHSTNKSNTTSNKASKIHGCSVCGAEFASGQALGGHMRRHRNPTTTSTAKVAMILETSPSTDHHHESSSHDIVEKSRNIFPLDLNLPAPSEDDLHRDLKFQFSANQQTHLVFLAPALVDCHY